MIPMEEICRALIHVLTSPPNVLFGEIVLRPRVV
jgi:hypothetical protein